jgi:serine/threonine protein phosphatase PrpC
MVVFTEDKIYCACLGDSVAIAVYDDHHYELLSAEHKPSNPEEAKRIECTGGIVRKTPGKEHLPCSPLRIWGQGTEEWGPGLAISRSFGDKMAQKYGLICEPEIREMEINRQLKYIVLGSDGLFDQVKPS